MQNMMFENMSRKKRTPTKFKTTIRTCLLPDDMIYLEKGIIGNRTQITMRYLMEWLEKHDYEVEFGFVKDSSKTDIPYSEWIKMTGHRGRYSD